MKDADGYDAADDSRADAFTQHRAGQEAHIGLFGRHLPVRIRQ